MSDLKRDALKKSLGLPPLPSKPGSLGRGGRGGWHGKRKRDYTPIPWDKYFDNREDIAVNETDVFRIYRSGDSGPVLLLLHGGGHSALSWAVFTKSVTKLCHCQILAVDIRGHGDSKTSDNSDLSAERLSDDVGNLVDKMYGDSPPPILLIGHSMGGAVAVHVGVKQLLPSLKGLALIDVVEGTALDALSSMQSFLRGRPQMFKSLEYGIEWSVRSGQIHNVESARVSMVGQLIRCDTSTIGAAHDRESPQPVIPQVSEPIQEQDEEAEPSAETATPKASAETSSPETSPETSTQKQECWKWRIDLSQTEQFWKGWFMNLSRLFLSVPVPKLLLLAGVDRLDRELTIGQMQGKFQMQLLPQCGHCVHEDAPDKVAEVIVTFLLRYKLTEAKEEFLRPMPAC